MAIRLFAGLSRVVATVDGYVIPLVLEAQTGSINVDAAVWRVLRPDQHNISDCQVSDTFIAYVLRDGEVKLFIKEYNNYQPLPLIELPRNHYSDVCVAASCCVVRDSDGYLWLMRQGVPVKSLLAGKRVTRLVSWEGNDRIYAVVEQHHEWSLYQVHLDRLTVREEQIGVFTNAIASLNLSDQYLYIHYADNRVQRWHVTVPKPVLDAQWQKTNVMRVISGRRHVLFIERSGVVSQLFHGDSPFNRSMDLETLTGSYVQCVAGFDITVLVNRAGQIRVCGRLNSNISIDQLLTKANLQQRERINRIISAIAQCQDTIFIDRADRRPPIAVEARHTFVVYDGHDVALQDVEVEGQTNGYISLHRWLEGKRLDERIRLMKHIMNCVAKLSDTKYVIYNVKYEDIRVGPNMQIYWQLALDQMGDQQEYMLDMYGLACILWRVFTLRTPYQINQTDDSVMCNKKEWPYADVRIQGEDREILRIKKLFAENESYDTLYGLFYGMFHGDQSKQTSQLASWQREVAGLT
jgi:hypothetical protein